MTDINLSGKAYLKHNGKIETCPSAAGSLRRNNSYHQRLKKSHDECEYAAASNNGQQSTGRAAKWKSHAAATSEHGSKPMVSVMVDHPSIANSADEFKRFHTLRNSYGGKSNLNVNTLNESAIKTQVLLHQQKLKEYSRHAAEQNNDSYSTCSSSQSDYQHPQHPHRHHHRYHHQHQQQQQQQHFQQFSQTQQYPVSTTVAATATLTRPGHGNGSVTTVSKGKDTSGGGGSFKNSLRRGAGGLSTLSLCSCDAETEIIPNPLRPLYQYSLDRKNPRQHTYTCEQNAQILLRLEKDRQRKYSSSGKLNCTASTNDLTALPSSGLQKSVTTTNVPTSGSAASTGTTPAEFKTGSFNNESSTFDYHSTYPENNYIEDEPFVEDLIPPPPPPLNRRPSYGYSCISQPLANEPSLGLQQQQHQQQPSVAGLTNDLTSTINGNNGIINNYPSNQPDLFNFASTVGNNGGTIGSQQQQQHQTGGYGTVLKSTLKNKSTARVSTSDDTTAAGSDTNKPKPKLKKSGSNFDIMNNGTYTDPATEDGVIGGADAGTILGKQFPPYYFDDNYLNHSLHQHFYYQNLDNSFPVSGVKNDAEGQLYLYHHEPASYIPNYDTLNLTGKYNTIGQSGTGNGDHMIGGDYMGSGKYHHASSCNLNQLSSAKNNLINSHQHHFSNSISNFNFNPSQYFGTGLEPAPGATIIGGPGGLGVLGGDGFTSTISLNGTPAKQQQQQQHQLSWKHRQCPSRGSSSTGSGSSKWDLPSRQWLAVTSILLIAGAAGVAVPFALKVSAGAPLEERLQVATQLLDTVPLIDGHNDLPWNIRKFLHNQLNEFRFDDDLKLVSPWSKSAWSHTDLQRMKRGRIAAQFWAAYVPCEAQHRDAVQITLEQIDVIKRLTERYSPHLTACTSVYDIMEAHKNHQMCSLIGVEGGHSLGGSLGVLRIYYALGVRYMTLTSTCHTPWADSSNADAPKYDVKHGGLTAYGKTIIREMNRLGMIVDLSKSSVATMKDTLATSQAPVIFSHSSAYALCNSSRNVQDEVLELVAKNRGLVMVNFYNKFLRCSENASVQDAVAHINHIRQIAGIDHVGLGAGYDGINFTPRDLEDVGSYPRLFAELLGNGWTAEELEKLAGRNLLRVLEEVEKVRDNQRLSGVRPYEDIPVALRADEHFNCTTNS
ncbi:uncharacterized protein LOC129780377 [Toxorhynchites rutilus septentrionalis]|uniref:uncharacterized protein LOC129780377 n=1 Tax=Toxorhynchites rutilus septentrionalis TaxID=329112 RepID=UPI00247B1C41|nr:uncharacterized protein LOC129780377 [Toxorhynchites rutilus septentrionalis]